MRTLVVETEQTENKPSIDLTQPKKSLEQEKSVLEERLRSYNLTRKAPDRRKGGKGGHSANCEAMPDGELLEKIRIAEATLKAVNQALQMVEDGTYGICQNCGNEIPLVRLKANPGACYCIECQTIKEKIRGGNGGNPASFV